MSGVKPGDSLSRGRRSKRHWAGVLLATCALAASLGPARTAAAETIEIEVTVAILSSEPGKVDPRGKKLLEKLSSQLRFESLKVIEQRQLVLAIDDVGEVMLPNRRVLRVKPLLVDARGALLAVEMEGTLESQLRVRSGHLVVLGPQRYQGGQLVVALEPHF